jgi:dTDP-4-dehydrorhamnose 3,5-epimerase
MRITPTGLAGLALIDLEPIEDERGFFARSYCRRELEQAGLDPTVAQCNFSFNRQRGTLRGMHWAAHPHREAKLVRCTAGAIFDVALDIRRNSPTFLMWEGFDLSAENRHGLYIPVGFAHGFQSLTDRSEVHYQMSTFYVPEAARGARWNDPRFAIAWPIADPVLSPKDASYRDFRDDDGL